jgi:hypothetical protein
VGKKKSWNILRKRDSINISTIFFELMFFAEEIFVEGEKSWSSLRNHDSITSTIFFELRTAVFLAERFGCGRSEER